MAKKIISCKTCGHYKTSHDNHGCLRCGCNRPHGEQRKENPSDWIPCKAIKVVKGKLLIKK